MNKDFQALGLSQAVCAVVEHMGYTSPTPVQEQAIPHVVEGRDVIAAAETGTGKTAAFALPLIDKIAGTGKSKNPRVLVLSPTRELAQQTGSFFQTASPSIGFRTCTVVGGVSYGKQLKKLDRGIDVLVATPGRLLDLIDRKAVTLSEVAYLVLDEADRMLDMGFWPDVKKIVALTPDERQTMLFSATMERSVVNKVSSILHDPAKVEIARSGTVPEQVSQYIVKVSQADKKQMLANVLNEYGSTNVIVFARTKHRTDACARSLNKFGFNAEAIHSDRSQAQRRRALDNFSKGKTQILVATDVLARGIDVSDVEGVINYDLPQVPEDYVHRIGRTGRAGKTGNAISFVSPDTRKELRAIENFVGEKIPAIDASRLKNDVPVRANVEHKQNDSAQSDAAPAAKPHVGQGFDTSSHDGQHRHKNKQHKNGGYGNGHHKNGQHKNGGNKNHRNGGAQGKSSGQNKSHKKSGSGSSHKKAAVQNRSRGAQGAKRHTGAPARTHA